MNPNLPTEDSIRGSASKVALTIIACIIFLFIFICTVLYFASPNFKSLLHRSVTRLNSEFSSFFHFKNEKTPDPSTITIEEFGSSTDVALISNDTIDQATSTASSTELLESLTKKLIPSPESAWSQIYLDELQMKQADLKLDIRYLKQWQQTGGFTRDLKLNSKGTDVKLMQYLLSIFTPEFSPSLATGTYGPKTKSALAKLQERLKLPATGMFNQETRFFFDSVYFKELCPDALPDQDKSYENVSRRISVPLDYIPGDLIRLPRSIRTAGVMCLSKEPASKLEEMFRGAYEENKSELAVFSAYRSANTQKQLVKFYLETQGPQSLEGVAEGGHSEHQLGTTVDISGKSIGYAGPSQKFGTTKEGKWLKENSYKYGFIMSYPQGKQSETGYIYEPWHFRYIGIDAAQQIHDSGMTIQEFLDQMQNTVSSAY